MRCRLWSLRLPCSVRSESCAGILCIFKFVRLRIHIDGTEDASPGGLKTHLEDVEDPRILSGGWFTRHLSACPAGLALILFMLRRRKQVPKGKSMTAFKMEGQINPGEIVICKRADGSDWLLGQGNFAQV